MKKITSYSCLLVLLFSQLLVGAPFKELTPKFNRLKSNAMVREITVATMANLDYAAYTANPVRFNPEKFKPKKPDTKIGLDAMSFHGLLSRACNRIEETPLLSREKSNPMAWMPLQNKIWDVLKTNAFAQFASKINGEKWADPSIFRQYQDIATLYLHGSGDSTEMWVKIEFAHWVKFLDGITDADKDGVREIFGKLNLDSVALDIRQKAFSWMRTDYLSKVLPREAIVDWANVLASYWYPSLNTDIMDMSNYEVWPNEETEKKVRKTMKGVVVKDPIMVIRGNPLGKPIYNVYVVRGLEEKKKAVAEMIPAVSTDNKMDTSISQNVKDNNARWKEELSTLGSYENWHKHNKSFLTALQKVVSGLPKEQMGIQGKEDWVFFRKSIEYMTGGDLANQPDDKSPLPHLVEFKKYLNQHKVNLLFVPIPAKSEVYPEYLPVEGAAAITPIVNPYIRKFMQDVQKAGIEVIDILPHYLKAKERDKNSKEKLYQKQDTHWTNRGIQIAAKLIAERVKQYSWSSILAQQPVAYTVHETTFSRQGDIVDKLPEADRPTYPAVTLEAQQIRTPEGTLNKGNKNAPLMLIGDSFTGVFELVDCKGAGIGSHVAAKTGIPVDIITSWGGGPLVRQKMVRARHKLLNTKRLVIYMMVVRDLYNYSQLWAPIQIKKQ